MAVEKSKISTKTITEFTVIA